MIAVHYAVGQLAVERHGVGVAVSRVGVVIVEIQGGRLTGGIGPEIGQCGMPEQIVASTGESGAIIAAIVDEHIPYVCSVAVGVNAHACVVFNNGIGDVGLSHVVFQHSLQLQAYEAVFDDGMVDAVSVSFAGFHKPNAVPLTGLVGIEVFESVALEYDRVFSCAVHYQLSFAPGPKSRTSMEIYSCAGFYGQSAFGVDKCHIINHIRLFSSPMHVFVDGVGDRGVVVGVMSLGVRENSDISNDVVGVLSVSRQMCHSLVAIGVEQKTVFHEEWIVLVGRVYGYLNKDIEAVVGVNFNVLESGA